MQFPLTVFRVEDRSMEPKMKAGDYLIVSRMYGKLSVGDVVVLRHPEKSMNIVKRISAIDGFDISVAGDNAERSEDSRSFGSISRHKILGKVIFHV